MHQAVVIGPGSDDAHARARDSGHTSLRSRAMNTLLLVALGVELGVIFWQDWRHYRLRRDLRRLTGMIKARQLQRLREPD